MPSSIYPFDPTGQAATNLVGSPVKETHSITATQGSDFNYIVPLAAPFFGQHMQVYKKGTGNTYTLLVEGVDYVLLHRFIAATNSLGKPIYGSVGLIDSLFSGTIGFTYQTLGGDWVLDDVSIIKDLTSELGSSRTVAWDQVAGYPQQFPPGPHSQDLETLKGLEELIDSLDGVKDAILSGGGGGGNIEQQFQQHLNGAVSHTASQVGLGNVQNYPIATVPIAQAATSNAHYLTPSTGKAMMLANTAGSANRLATTRAITLAGDVTGTANFDGSGDITIQTTSSNNLSAAITVNTSSTSAVNTNLTTTGIATTLKLIIQSKTTVGIQATELLVIIQGSTAECVEYGTVFTGASKLANFDVLISGTNVVISIIPTTATAMVHKVNFQGIAP